MVMELGKKRILCLVDSLASGGAQRQMVGLASLLKGEGYQIKVVTYFDIPFYMPQLRECGVDYEYVACGTGLVDRLRKLGRVIKQFRPDVVVSYLDTPNILACLIHIANKNRWKLIVSERNTTQALSRRERIKFALFRFADNIVPNSFSQCDFMAKHYSQYADKCHVITNFVDTEIFSPVAKEIDSDVLRIIGVGRVLKQKNIPMLIEAVKIIREKGCNVRVNWYGEKFDTYNECVRLISQYSLEGVFEFHEPCKNIIEKYRESDLFVLPSIYEGFPNVLCEAMSCGLPVIATDVCDNGRIVQHKENGYLIPSGDTKELADRLLQFIELSPIQRKAMGEKSRSIAVDMFSKESFVKEYIRLF